MANTKKCKECGCQCLKCGSTDHDVHLHVEIENLKQRLVERDSHILNMETNFLIEANKYPNGELGAVQEELLTWQDKYKRLYEAHKRVQRVNQGLEDKLLKLVDTCETDKNTLTRDVATLSHKLAEANYTIKKLTEDNERYKNDVSLAIQFLQCKPGNFISQKVDSLPNEVQAKVSSYLQGKRKPEEKKSPPDIKSIKVPIPTFPPTAMVYSVPKSPRPDRHPENQPVDIVSAAIMAKILEERERERANLKHCDTCTCSKNINKIIHHTSHHTVSTQTSGSFSDSCLKCNRLDAGKIGSHVQIVKHSDKQVKNKSVPKYVHDTNANANQNIAKVQPNNFLMDLPVNNAVKFDELNQTVLHYNVNETNKASKLKKEPQKTVQYELCDMSSDLSSVKNDASTHSAELLKGPRYCSMRVQTGSKNILLDNTHNNVAPVLYTRHQQNADSRENSSFQYKRVAEWVETNNRNDGSESSMSESSMTSVNKEKYAEMEKNVKRFLFGENDFMKTVELGKQKYLDYQGDEGGKARAETDI